MNVRNLVYLAGVLFLSFLASCKGDDPEVIVYEAEMTSFGFYAEDNEGVIVQDYVNDSFTGTAISILLPDEVDKSSLVARFTVTENDVVKVGEVVQQSGVTANDFTVPVDYFVSEGTANVKYTVTVGKAPDYVWTVLPGVSDAAASAIMKVSPEGTPYIVYKMKREASAEEALGAYSLDNGEWKSLGQVSEGRVGTYYDIAFNSKDLPAVSFLDYTSSIAQLASVKSFNGSAWSFVGAPEATSNKVTYHALSYVNDNKLQLAAMYDARDNVLVRRELSINTFEGGSWTHNATMPGRPSDLTAYLMVSVKQDDAIYLGVYNAVSPNTVSVYKYENNTWTVLVDKWTDENATGINIRDFDIDVDREGSVFLAFADNSSDAVYKHRVIKYDAETKAISSVGNYLEGASGNLFNFDLALSPLGVPYLFYRNASLFPTLVYLDHDTQDWTTPKVFEAEEANDLSIDFAPDGKGYLVYRKGNDLLSYKYDVPQE